jgi:hypothetical protein
MVSTKHKYIDVILVTLLPFETRTVLYLSKLAIGGPPRESLKRRRWKACMPNIQHQIAEALLVHYCSVQESEETP